MDKLYYGLTEEERAEALDHLLHIKFDGDLSDVLRNALKENALNVNKMMNAGKWMGGAQMPIQIDLPKEKIAEIKIEHDTKFAYPGQKAVILVGKLLLSDLENWYRINKYINKEMGVVIKQVQSFEEFIQNFVAGKVNEMMAANHKRLLDEEEAAIKAEQEKEKADKNPKPEPKTSS